MFTHTTVSIDNDDKTSFKIRKQTEELYLLSIEEWSSGLFMLQCNFEQLEELHNVLTIALNEGGR